MAEFTLYGHPRSGNAYKTALLLSFTETPFDLEIVDLMGGGNLSPEYLAINPMGKVPTLVHGDLIIRQSYDTLRYLAEHTGRFGAGNWEEQSRIADWAGYSVDFLSYGVARLRFERLFGKSDPTLLAHFGKVADRGLGIVETHLEGREWLACDRPTIADISCFPVMTYLEDAGYDPADYPNTVAWMERFRTIPGWRPQREMMPLEGW